MNRIGQMLILLLCFVFTGCAKDTPTVVSITHDTGDREYHILIGYDSLSVKQTLMNKSNHLEPFFTDIEYLSLEAVDHIAEYITANCRNVSLDNNVEFTNFFIFGIYYPNEKSTKCNLIEDTMDPGYFRGLIKWIQESPYNKESENLIKKLKVFVR